MRLVRPGIMITLFVALAALPARADLSASGSGDCVAWDAGAVVASHAVPVTHPPQRTLTDRIAIDPIVSTLIASEAGAGQSPAEDRAEQSVRELPPLPDSASLFLSAILSVGAWQLVRSAKQFDMAAAPEWYHVDGPTQIGHATVFDLDMSVPVLCRFEQPETDHASYHILPERTLRLHTQHVPAVAVPRGPPISC